jgi:hypothetical protein
MPLTVSEECDVFPSGWSSIFWSSNRDMHSTATDQGSVVHVMGVAISISSLLLYCFLLSLLQLLPKSPVTIC